MTEIACPYCGQDIELTGHMDDFDWNYDYAQDTITCPSCRSELVYEVEAHITEAQVIRSSESALAQRARREAYLEEKGEWQREDRS